MRRLAAVLGTLVTALGAAVISAPGAEAQALAMGQCTTSQNVVLAVDFGHWGGPVVRACGSTPTTGFQLLNQGGFRTEGTKHDGPAFICRIQTSAFRNGTAYPRPTEDGQTCGPTPPASAYWSYWHADAAQDSWSYSQLGAMSYKPKPGSVDLWQFGGTNISGTQGQPTISPDDVRARNASGSSGSGAGTAKAGSAKNGGGSNGGKGSAKHSGGSGRSAPGSGATAVVGRQPGRSAGPASSSSAGRAGPARLTATRAAPGRASSASSGAATGAAASASGPSIVDADPASAAPREAESGSALPVLLGLGLAVVLAAGAGFTMLRRRRADPEL